MSVKYIHPFSFGDRTQSDLLGGKGANLAEMVKIGLPVPPGEVMGIDDSFARATGDRF